MNTIKLVMLSTFLSVAAGSATAQTTIDRAEQSRMNAEMNRPAAGLTLNRGDGARTTPPVSQADRRAEEFRKNTEMMRPSTYSATTTSAQVAGAPMNAADQKVADTMQRTERMKPN